MTHAGSLVDFLRDPTQYPFGADEVRIIESDEAWIALAGEFAYKVHRPIKHEDRDLSTPELREKACGRELRYNRRWGGDIYLDVLPIYRSENGYSFSGEAAPAEFALRMRRLPSERMMDVVLSNGSISEEDKTAFVDLLGEIYASAKVVPRTSKSGRIASIEPNCRLWLATASEGLGATPELARLEAALLLYLAANEEVFAARIDQEKIIEGHGDLRAEHVCLGQPPIIIGSVDARDRDRNGDVLADLGQLIIDIIRRGRRDEAYDLWARLASSLNEEVDTPLVHFYRAYRALSNARRELVIGESDTDHVGRAREWVTLAVEEAAAFYKPRLLVVFGLMGTGKTTLTEALAGVLGLTRLSSEEVSKTLYPNSAQKKSFANRLDPAQADAIYAELARQVQVGLGAGLSVVVDASFLRSSHRQLMLELAASEGIVPEFFECRLSKSDAIARLDRRFKKNRTRPGSRPELYEEQLLLFESPDEIPDDMHHILNMNQPVPQLVEVVRETLT